MLAGGGRAFVGRPVRELTAERGLVVELADSGFVGAVVAVEGRVVELEDRTGRVRSFPLGAGYLIDGEPVILKTPASSRPAGPTRTASGSFAVANRRARTARASRILVEGRHDAELVERVWGEDLRVEGVVVEYLSGVDHLEEVIRDRAPAPGRRIGVLVDHLVPRSKESRIAEAVREGPYGDDVLVVGHPYIDIWQAVKPARVGLDRWPTIPRDVEFKRGMCRALGWPNADQADIAHAWKRILATVRDYTDLEPELLGRVEQLIDFVTDPVG